MKGKILVIEDNEAWIDIFRAFLTKSGFYVDIVSDINSAVKKINDEKYHFITIDMQLNKFNLDKYNYEGWTILDTINKLRINDITPTIVITAFEEDYKEIKTLKKLDSVFFMSKKVFDPEKLIQIIEREITRINLRFKNDYRGDY